MTGGVTHIVLALQAASAAVAGRVTDGATGEPLAAAHVWLSDLERRAVTDADGRYAFSGVLPGPHHIVVRRIGYAPRTLHALVPGQGTIEITIALRAEPVTLGAVEARPAVAMHGLDDADTTSFPSRGLSAAAIRNHPRLAEPDGLEALEGGEVVLRPESPSGLHVRGGASDQVAYLLDGIPVFNPYHTAGRFTAWNPDALAAVRLDAVAPASSDALSGVVTATTREPGPQLLTQGSVSTTHARITIDGPLGGDGAGFLYSRRVGFAGFPTPDREASYLRGGTGDWFAKIESPVAGGRARVLGFESESEFDVAAAPESAGVAPPRHAFAWHSRSVGGDWTGRVGSIGVVVRAWSALGDAAAGWVARDSTLQSVRSQRRDAGALASVQAVLAGGHSTLGVRAQRSHTAYRTDSVAWNVHTPVIAAFVEHARRIDRRTTLDLGLTSAWAAGGIHLSPRAEARWTPASGVSVSGGYTRVHQFAQSLRNAESVAGTVFPADLFVGAGGGIPVASSDLGFAAIEYRPSGAARVGVQAYVRDFDGLALVAPRNAAPFATTGFVAGSGVARGAAVDVAVNGARYGISAGYGLQHVRLTYGDSSYIPDHGAMHSLDAGFIVFPTATFSVRLGATTAFGRRATAAGGAFEWEACNLLDAGCEFAGAPEARSDALGATPLPAYLRVDLGVRKHWHVRIGGHDGLVALFGTVSNVFGRRNVLTFADDPGTGARVPVDMRPLAPLVVGLDWRF